MNKADLINAVAAATGLSKAKAGQAIDAMIDAITGALKKGESVTLVGFGSFSVRQRAARSGRNPRTGAPIRIPARRVPVFRPGKDLKNACA